jgi:Fic family protein
MEQADYAGAYGELERVEHERLGTYHAFVPGPLPPEVDFSDTRLVRSLYDATRTLSKLSGICVQLPNPSMLITPYLRREAVLSSQIEGTRVSLSELLLSEAQDREEAGEVREVFNYIVALRYALERVYAGEPVTTELVRKMHELLMRGVRGEDKQPGEYRSVQNWIAPPFTEIRHATFVPPPPGRVPELMEALVAYINNDSGDEVPLVKCALMHYQFETVHPFCDGNGRIGRALVTLYLCKCGIIEKPILYVSGYFSEHKSEYMALLRETNMRATFTQWLLFFFEALRVQAEDAQARARALLSLRESYRASIIEKGLSARHLAVVDGLFYNPYVTVRKVEEAAGVTYPTARGIVEALVSAGILSPTDAPGRAAVYVAHDILRHIAG